MKPEDIKPWKIKRSEYLVKRPWLTARRDVVELPDGREIPEYYVLEYPDWVNVIAIDKAGRFIMEKQYRHGMQRMSYELPCGVMEKGETPLEAAKRELLEETGYTGGKWQLLMEAAPNPGSMSNMQHCFLATGVEPTGTQHTISDRKSGSAGMPSLLAHSTLMLPKTWLCLLPHVMRWWR